MSLIIGVERMASVVPRLVFQAIFASFPLMMLRKLSRTPPLMVLETMTGDRVPTPHRSWAASVAVMLCEKSPRTEP